MSISQGPMHKPMPVAGYQPQSDENVQLVNKFKREEERLLRDLDAMFQSGGGKYDLRWLSIGRKHLEQAFMAINRSVFQPKRLDGAID